jgi:hypothetical protein
MKSFRLAINSGELIATQDNRPAIFGRPLCHANPAGNG